MYKCNDCQESFEEEGDAKLHYLQYGHTTTDIDWDEYEEELAEKDRLYQERNRGSINEALERFSDKTNR